MVTKLLQFKTQQQKVLAKKSGRIDGYFATVAKGRPTRPAAVSVNGSLPMNKTTKDVITASKKGSKAMCCNWNLPGNFHLLKAHVLAHIKAKEANDNENDDMPGLIPAGAPIIPRTTLQCHVDCFHEIAKKKKMSVQHLISDKCRGGGKGLLNKNEIELLASTLIYHDEANNGMSRNEAITLVMELAQTTNRVAAENHFDYLVRKKLLRGVKNHGRTVKAQPTTTKRTQITVEQQLRWQSAMEEALEFQK